MNDLKKIRRYSDDIYDLTFICNGKDKEFRRGIDFDNLEIVIKNFCGHIYKVQEVYQSVNYDSQILIIVQSIPFYTDTDSIKIALANTNIAKYRKILLEAMDAHRAMKNQREYDYAFRMGMKHALEILDDFCDDTFKKACMEAINKEFGGLKNDI